MKGIRKTLRKIPKEIMNNEKLLHETEPCTNDKYYKKLINSNNQSSKK